MIKLVQYHFVPYIFVYEAKLEIQFNNYQVPPSLILHIGSSKGRRSGYLNRKGLPPQLFKPMRDSCHSFLSCDPGQEKWTNESGGQRSSKMAAAGGSVIWDGKPLTPQKKDRGLIQDGG